MASAGDIPHKFDLLVNGEGFVFADAEQQKAVLGYSPPFIARTAIQGTAYGDSEQEFFQTFTQKDWSKGEKQRYQGRDEEAVSRYWRGTNIEVGQAGQVSLRPLTNQTTAFGTAVTEMAAAPNVDRIFATGASNLYEINTAGTITDQGAHGVGAAPTALCIGGSAAAWVYMSVAGGAVRRWNGSAFATFSATGARALGFVSNTLYGLGSGAFVESLLRYDTAGAVTTVYTWRDAEGNSVSFEGRLVPFGGKLLILRPNTEEGSELWLFDGVAPAKIANFSNGFLAQDVTVADGVVFVSGYLRKRLSAAEYRKPTIYYYASGSVGKLWESDSWVVSTAAREPRMTGFQGGLLFTDDTRGVFMFYDPAVGGVHSVGTYTFTDATPRLAATSLFALHTRAATQPWRFPADGTSTSGTITTSLIDFDSSLNKRFRSIEVEYDEGSDGDGGSIDIAYRVGDVDGSYTTLVTGATSSTENLLTNISGKSISVKVTLNKGTSTSGPVLKRIKVRAVPVRPAFRKDTYLLNLAGRDGNNVRLRDGANHVKDGKSMATDLRTAATATNPITIIDTFGTYTGVIEQLELIEVRPEEFLARVTCREV